MLLYYYLIITSQINSAFITIINIINVVFANCLNIEND